MLEPLVEMQHAIAEHLIHNHSTLYVMLGGACAFIGAMSWFTIKHRRRKAAERARAAAAAKSASDKELADKE